MRATVEGVELSGRLSFNGKELIWSDGDTWRRLVPEGRRRAEPSERAPTDCIVAAYERSIGVAPVRDVAHEVELRQPEDTGVERDRKRKKGKKARKVAPGQEDQAAAQHAP